MPIAAAVGRLHASGCCGAALAPCPLRAHAWGTQWTTRPSTASRGVSRQSPRVGPRLAVSSAPASYSRWTGCASTARPNAKRRRKRRRARPSQPRRRAAPGAEASRTTASNPSSAATVPTVRGASPSSARAIPARKEIPAARPGRSATPTERAPAMPAAAAPAWDASTDSARGAATPTSSAAPAIPATVAECASRGFANFAGSSMPRVVRAETASLPQAWVASGPGWARVRSVAEPGSSVAPMRSA